MSTVGGAAKRLRTLLEDDGLIEAPGAHDVLSAQLAERLGFGAVLLGGGAAANFAYGLPDMGLLTSTEVVDHVRRVASATEIPLIADLDDGGGTPMLIHRVVRLAEAAGAAAVMIEDLDSAHKHHWDEEAGGWDQSKDHVIPVDVAARNIAVAVEARRNPDTVIVARTDAYAIHGLDEAIGRAKAFADVGADVVFATLLPASAFGEMLAAVPLPLMNAIIDTPTARQRAAQARAGLKIAIYPLQSMIAAHHGVLDAFLKLKAGKPVKGSTALLEEVKSILEVVDLPRWTEIQRGSGRGR